MLTLLKLIDNLSESLYYWTDDKIKNHKPIRINRLPLAVICSLLFVIFGYFYTKPEKKKVMVTQIPVYESNEYNNLKNQFTWLNQERYDFIKNVSEKEFEDTFLKKPELLVMAIVQKESGNHCNNNWNCMVKVRGTSGEYGAMQVMGYHAPNPDDLKEWKYNFKRGIKYLRGAYENGSGNLRVTIRLYNQGHNGLAKNYRRWGYVRYIANVYKKILIKNVMVASNE